MQPYPYRSELKPPGPLSGIDFSSPAMAPMVRMVVRNLQQAVRQWQPPAGLRLSVQQVTAADGAASECFVLEPEGSSGRPLPGMLFCHGGGFFLPLQVSALKLAAHFAQQLKLRVFLPDYRLLPAAPAPAAWQDCLAVYQRMFRDAGRLRLDAERVLLYGESAGGTLTAGLAAWARDQGLPAACGQLLIYPALDEGGSYPSRAECRDAAWPLRSNEWMWREYLKNRAAYAELLPYLVPLRNEKMDGLPPAYIEPQGIDILRDEAVAYAERLRQAGVPVQLNLIEGSYHGFDSETENPFVGQVLSRRVEAMRRMLGQ